MAQSALQELLESIRASATSEKDKGDKFERLMLAYFRTEPAYRRQFENVWLWSDWPDNKGKPDTGIDLVAKNSDGSGYTAIQCKNYAPTTTLDKHDIDSFFTASGNHRFLIGSSLRPRITGLTMPKTHSLIRVLLFVASVLMLLSLQRLIGVVLILRMLTIFTPNLLSSVALTS